MNWWHEMTLSLGGSTFQQHCGLNAAEHSNYEAVDRLHPFFLAQIFACCRSGPPCMEQTGASLAFLHHCLMV